MKKRLYDTSFIFLLLQGCAVAAVLLGGLAIVFALHTPWFILECILWIAAWADFFLMCRRLRTEPSSFTQKNARTLLVISCCCGVIGLMQLAPWVRALFQLHSFADALIMLEELLIPVVFLGVAAVGITLRGLLLRAMALEKENELTI